LQTDFLPRLKLYWSGRTALERSVTWVLLSVLLFSMMGALAKLLGGHLDSFQVAFFRSLFGFIFILPVIFRAGLAGLRTRRPMLHLWRGLVGGAAIMCSFYAIIHLPLADATALSFTRALFLVPLAAFFLNEQFDLRRTLTILAGLAGVVMMTAPEGVRPDRRLQKIGMAAGAGLVLLGVVMWGAASSKQSEIDDAPVNTPADFVRLRQLEQDADGLAGGGNLFFLGGVALGGISTYYYWKKGRHARAQTARITPTVFPHGAGVVLTFGGAR